MKAKWLIEDCIYDKYTDLLIEEIITQGYEYKKIKYCDFDVKNLYDNNDCVVVQSSFRFANKVIKNKTWIPGIWLTKENYDCKKYYNLYKKYLFNSDYVYSTINDLNLNRNFYFDTYGKNDFLFIRPNNGIKSFAGSVFDLKSFDYKWVFVEKFTNENDIIVISSPKTIKSECRFIVANNEIISGSTYSLFGESNISDKYPNGSFELAKEILKTINYSPDPVWVMDICEDEDNKFYLLEIGCFSCCGLYRSNFKNVVSKISEIAINEWNNKQL
jgi:hypothetical protein